MDRPRPAPHSLTIGRGCEGTIPPLASDRTTRHRYQQKTPATMLQQCTTSISQLQRYLRAEVWEGPTPILNLGPRHRVKARSSSDPYKQNHMTLPDRTTGALPIPTQTHKTRNNPTIEKPIRSIILLY